MQLPSGKPIVIMDGQNIDATFELQLKTDPYASLADFICCRYDPEKVEIEAKYLLHFSDGRTLDCEELGNEGHTISVTFPNLAKWILNEQA